MFIPATMPVIVAHWQRSSKYASRFWIIPAVPALRASSVPADTADLSVSDAPFAFATVTMVPSLRKISPAIGLASHRLAHVVAAQHAAVIGADTVRRYQRLVLRPRALRSGGERVNRC